MLTIESTMAVCDNNNQLLRCPNKRVNIGIGNTPTTGAQTNLNENAKAAQLKKVTVLRSMPASRNHSERDEKISNKGIPAEIPKKNKAKTLGSKKAFKLFFSVAVSVVIRHLSQMRV